mmetsp:Transcript_2236/g.3930  ORF Transcript_2236/g.3930 Transcript_2236/m.3930 type:complete len:186 (-) Transcript_2236:788-1345(-)
MTSPMLTTHCAAASASPMPAHLSRQIPQVTQSRCCGASLCGPQRFRRRVTAGRTQATSRRANLSDQEAEELFRKEQEAELMAMQKLSQEWWKFDSQEIDPEHLEERLEEKNVDPATVAALILGGGTGNGLYPLTEVLPQALNAVVVSALLFSHTSVPVRTTVQNAHRGDGSKDAEHTLDLVAPEN